MNHFQYLILNIFIDCPTPKSGAARASTDFNKDDKFPILHHSTKTAQPWLSPELT